MNRRELLAVTALALAASGCKGGDGPAGLSQCQGALTVTADSGTISPSFAWTPSCRASRLIVDPNSDIVDYWVLATVADTNGLFPPIRYGARPSGSVTLFGPVGLQGGTSYRVRVLRATGDTALPFEVIGATLFRP